LPGESGEQVDCARKRSYLSDIARKGFGVKSWKLLRLFGAHRVGGLTKKRVDEQAAAHPDAAVDAPHSELNPCPFQGLPPGQNMLVDAINQGAVEIKEESWRSTGYLHLLTPGVFWVEGFLRVRMSEQLQGRLKKLN